MTTSTPVDHRSLSDRELEVLELLPGPQTATQIAATLFVSPNTARTHIKAIFRKLEVHTRDDAVTRARAAGLIGGG